MTGPLLVTDDGNRALPVRATCGCGSARRLPLRVLPEAVSALAGAAGEDLRPDTPLMTYRCRVCKEVVVLRAADLHFTNPMPGRVARGNHIP
ncbi:MAG TPA: hypothetical protein VK837_08910 [Longimicrobiales bacterium]|nr:hypothetical protein [Longimicrobiales bacterium]